MANTLYIMCGPAGCGKSTFLKIFANKISKGCATVSRDEIRFRLLSDTDDYFAKEKEVFNTYAAVIANELKHCDVFADSTCCTKGSRKKLINAVKKHNKKFEVSIIYFFDDDIDYITQKCINQNNLRSGRAKVPEDVIKNMCKNFEIPDETENFTSMINGYEYMKNYFKKGSEN